MSKLSFRARALDASKPMPVYRSDEIPDLPDFAAINRAVPQMPTGMEKEEESEHHLQRALSAQQVYGSAEALVIPVPDVVTSDGLFDSLYSKNRDEFKPPKQYVHVQAVGMEQEIPDYDMDSEDETWFDRQTKKMEITPLQFENMMDRLEKGSGQQVVTLPEAKLLLKEDDDLIIAVYDYWLNKRLRMQHALIPQVKTEKRDGSTTNNPYVAFRRRTEKMQTRKNRKNDEASYEKMLKLRRDLNKALTILEMMKRREKSKKELLQLTIEVNEKRYQMGDFNGAMLSEARAQRHTRPTYVPLQNQYVKREWASNREETGYRKKREYKKRKHKQQAPAAPVPPAPQYTEVDILQPDTYSSDDDVLSPPMSPSDHEDENDPDGIYAFRRKKNCSYHAPILDGLGNWPWCGAEEGGFGDKKYRYSLTSLTSPRRCIGFARRRIGRGGRIILDRAFTPWDDELSELDLTCSNPASTRLKDYITHIKGNKHLHFRPKTPTEDVALTLEGMSPSCSGAGVDGNTAASLEINVESFQSHQEALLQMQRQQQEALLRYQSNHPDTSFDLDHSFSSQPTSRFTLDSASAQFAASAVRNPQLELLYTAPSSVSVVTTPVVSTTPPVSISAIASALSNGPTSVVDNRSGGFSTSPAATVLQLNFPLPVTQSDNGLVSSAVTASTLGSTPASVASSSSSSSSLSTKTIPHSSPTLLKLTAPTTTLKNDPLTVDNHQDTSSAVNNIVKETVVAMEVT